MLSEINKVNKDNPIFVSFLLYFVPISLPPAYFDPRLINFQNPWSPPFIMNLRVFICLIICF